MIDAQIKKYDLVIKIPLDKNLTLEQTNNIVEAAEEALEMVMSDASQTKLDDQILQKECWRNVKPRT